MTISLLTRQPAFPLCVHSLRFFFFFELLQIFTVRLKALCEISYLIEN